jgi:hypothetical protein
LKEERRKLIRATANIVSEICKNRYSHLLNDGDNEFISHFGELSQDMVNQASSEIEERLFSSEIKKPIVKKVFSIMVEGLQNIRLHGEKDANGNQPSFFIIKESEDNFKIFLGNLVFNANIDKIKARINQVNSLDKTEIKALYLDVLTNGIISNKGGAGLGFITMSMKSMNPIVGHFEKIDGEISNYDLEITIDKVKKTRC